MNPEKLCINCMREAEYPNGTCEYCGFDPEQYQLLPHHLEPQTILKGRYMLGTVLGEGGFGITYIAYDLVLERTVAIKELFIMGILTREQTNTVLVDGSLDGQRYYQECKDKFLQEAQLLYTLGDKGGVVNIFDYFEENGTAYLVMEYLMGMDLLAYVKSKGGRIPYEDAFRLLRPVMRSMILVHRAGIIHRDIAPDNLRYVDDNHVKIMDFGSSKYNYSDYSSHIVLVKPGYAPREQYVKNYKVGPWMDVYAMAATFYRCVTGKVPKPSMDRLDDQDIETPASLGAGLPPALEQVILKALSLKPEDRYQDMWEFYQAMKAAMPGMQGAAQPGAGSGAPGTGMPGSGAPGPDTQGAFAGGPNGPAADENAAPRSEAFVPGQSGSEYSELMEELSSGTEKKTGLVIGIAAAVVIALCVILIVVTRVL